MQDSLSESRERMLSLHAEINRSQKALDESARAMLMQVDDMKASIMEVIDEKVRAMKDEINAFRTDAGEINADLVAAVESELDRIDSGEIEGELAPLPLPQEEALPDPAAKKKDGKDA